MSFTGKNNQIVGIKRRRGRPSNKPTEEPINT